MKKQKKAAKAEKKCDKKPVTTGDILAGMTIYDLCEVLADAVKDAFSCKGACEKREMSPGEKLMWQFIREQKAKKSACGSPMKRSMDEAGEFLVRYLVEHSRYSLSGLEHGYRYNMGGDRAALDIFLGKRIEADGVTQVVTEIFTVPLYPDDPARSVKEFDEAISGLSYIRPPLKEATKAKPDVEKAPADPCGKCRCSKEKAIDKFVKVLTSKKALEGFKQFLLKSSKYTVPSTRFKVLFDRTDRKSQKFVYELRFFQGNYRKDETQSYESVPLRVRMDGDSGDLIARRFDKAVEGLRFNEFPAKAGK